MIQHTFSMLHGIGQKTEKSLWHKGILTWEDFLRSPNIEGISPLRKQDYDAKISDAINALVNDDVSFFVNNVKRRDQWRLYEHYAGDVLCLDIETNGLQIEQGGYVTVVGLYDGFDYKALVRGQNLTVENLKNALKGYKCLITFNGALFDIPFLKRSFDSLTFDILHFDICLCCRQIGLKMGLKKLEVYFGYQRDEQVQGLNGYDAVRLWDYASKGSTEALQTLIKYNEEDTRCLHKLAPAVYEQLKANTGIYEYIK